MMEPPDRKNTGHRADDGEGECTVVNFDRNEDDFVRLSPEEVSRINSDPGIPSRCRQQP
jgi:hypothetical protein